MNTSYVYSSGLDNVTLISYYEKLRKKLKSIISYLNKSISSLDGVDGDLMKCYTLNNETVNGISIESIRENLKSRVSYLKYTIIPSIDSKINSLN